MRQRFKGPKPRDQVRRRRGSRCLPVRGRRGADRIFALIGTSFKKRWRQPRSAIRSACASNRWRATCSAAFARVVVAHRSQRLGIRPAHRRLALFDLAQPFQRLVRLARRRHAVADVAGGQPRARQRRQRRHVQRRRHRQRLDRRAPPRAPRRPGRPRRSGCRPGRSARRPPAAARPGGGTPRWRRAPAARLPPAPCRSPARGQGCAAPPPTTSCSPMRSLASSAWRRAASARWKSPSSQ